MLNYLCTTINAVGVAVIKLDNRLTRQTAVTKRLCTATLTLSICMAVATARLNRQEEAIRALKKQVKELTDQKGE
ncbi:MAG: hypothetical protein RR559_00010 [Bacteroides sp.]